ncbi:hypothetical protein BAU15_13335 [Enterococcus sp. JM4C]|uniref:metallophosphoesterase n=1 Tax=Candidatus Enterococcus huntleyi TaxID=1857217 RepID=UPI00137A7024|nr:metallophosphoesterase [Enterococcus sp. JM4C]KAF1296669.1 hypothetical protein BAU15_13335 [Enterococcus sp. JM4C]
MLKCREDGTFTIAQFTDLHLGYPANEETERTYQELTACLATMDADLLVLTGDQVWCYGEYQPEKAYQRLINLLNTCPIPVTVTYGNHDSEHGKISRAQLRAMENCLVNRVMPENEQVVRNRKSESIDIYDATGERIVKQLFIIDSGDYIENQASLGLKDKNADNYYAYLYPEQITWFNQTCKENGKGEEALIFLHIPLVEYNEASKQLITGECREEICCSEINSGFFAALLEKNIRKSVFCGHDHDNNFIAEWLGVGLNYGLIGGYNVYGEFDRGYRRIILHKEKNLETSLVYYSAEKCG